MARGGTGTGDDMDDMMKNSIKQISFRLFQFYTQDYPEHTSRLW